MLKKNVLQMSIYFSNKLWARLVKLRELASKLVVNFWKKMLDCTQFINKNILNHNQCMPTKGIIKKITFWKSVHCNS